MTMKQVQWERALTERVRRKTDDRLPAERRSGSSAIVAGILSATVVADEGQILRGTILYDKQTRRTINNHHEFGLG